MTFVEWKLLTRYTASSSFQRIVLTSTNSPTSESTMLGISLVLAVLLAMQGMVFSLPVSIKSADIEKHVLDTESTSRGTVM